MDTPDFDRLIVNVAKGDMDSLESLYNLCARGIYALAYSIVRSSAAAEDIMQDTFVRVHSGAKSFRPAGNGRAWIYRIARNLALNQVTRSKADSLDEFTEANGDCISAPNNTENTVVDSVTVAQALDALSDAEREIVTLHAMSGLTLNEIAKLTDSPIGTVKWRHAEALKKMKALLTDNSLKGGK